MSTCHGCGGIVGRDCFNPQECEAITRDMAQRYQDMNERDSQPTLPASKPMNTSTDLVIPETDHCQEFRAAVCGDKSDLVYMAQGVRDICIDAGTVHALRDWLNRAFPVETTAPRLTDAECDEAVRALETYEWTGLTRDDVRLLFGTIWNARGAEKTSSPRERDGVFDDYQGCDSGMDTTP